MFNDRSRSVVISADLHLQKKPGMWASRTEIAGDDLFGAQQVFELSAKRNASLLLLGDVVDTSLNFPRPIRALQRFLHDGLASGMGSLYFVQGQHDFVVQASFENTPWLALLPEATHLHGQEFSLFGLRAYAHDYFQPGAADEFYASIPQGTEVLFVHGTADAAMAIGYHFEMSKLPASVRYVFAGDYHIATDRKVGDTWLHYPGSTYLNSVGEPMAKSALVISYNAAEDGMTVERVPIKTRPMYYYSEVKDDLTKIVTDATLPEALQKPLVLVDEHISSETSAVLATYAFTYTEPSLLRPKVNRSEPIVATEEYSDEEILGQYIDQKLYPEAFAFTLGLLTSGQSTQEVMASLRNKLGIVQADMKGGGGA